MKMTMTAVMMVLGMATAHADGFVCEGQQSGVKVKLFNNINPSIGTRLPAILVLSDASVQGDTKTIAKFSGAQGNLDYLGYGKFSAKVDLRFTDSARKGENIAGTKLGQLKTIVLDLDFQYTPSSTDLASAMNEVSGRISYNKRNGEVLSEKVDCVRYLKN